MFRSSALLQFCPQSSHLSGGSWGEHLVAFAYPGLTDGRGGGGGGGGGGRRREPWAMLSIHVEGFWEMTGGYHTCPACRVTNRDGKL